MSRIEAIFSDVGGVIGSNAWSCAERQKAVEEFQIDGLDFEDRHELVVNAFETGHLSLDAYLDRTIFYRPRNFSRQRFQEFMFAQSRVFPQIVERYARLAESGKVMMAALNNESLELNLHRIEKFGLRGVFSVFFSSCFVGIKKPHDAIFSLALQLTQRQPESCLFIDDRLLNVERARQCGMQAVHCQDPARLPSQLQELGVDV